MAEMMTRLQGVHALKFWHGLMRQQKYTYGVLLTFIGDALIYSSVQSPVGASTIRLLSSTHLHIFTFTACSAHICC